MKRRTKITTILIASIGITVALLTAEVIFFFVLHSEYGLISSKTYCRTLLRAVSIHIKVKNLLALDTDSAAKELAELDDLAPQVVFKDADILVMRSRTITGRHHKFDLWIFMYRRSPDRSFGCLVGARDFLTGEVIISRGSAFRTPPERLKTVCTGAAAFLNSLSWDPER